MMGPEQHAQAALCDEFSIEEFASQDHPRRGIDRYIDLPDVRPLLAPSSSSHCPAGHLQSKSADRGLFARF